MLSNILIPGCHIICEQVITIDFELPNRNFFLLKGTVYTPKHEPLPNAAIEVIQKFKWYDNYQEKSMGITFTKEDGTYGMVLPICTMSDYILVAYSPLNSSI
jgi:hypothetical protein